MAQPPICFHALPGGTAADVTRAASGAPWVKVCDASAIPVAIACGASVFYRPYLPDDGDCPDGIAWARQVFAALQAAGGAMPDAIGFRNECSASVRTGAQYLRYRAALRALGYAGLVALGSFGTGQPDWPQWADLVAGLGGFPPDAVELHEYWSLTIDGSAPWWALRHVEAIRRGVLPADWPTFIGECGSDDVGTEDPQRRRGWDDRGKLSAEQELANLLAYRRRCAPSARACFVFGDGGADPRWIPFHTFDTPIEAGIRATWRANGPISSGTAPISPATPPAPRVTASPAGPPGKDHTLNVDAVPELNQGATEICWAECVQEAFAGAGYSVSVYDLYKQVKGVDYVAPGAPATFAELTACVRAGAALTGAKVTWYGADGRVNDLGTFDQLLRDGHWLVVVGVSEQALVDHLGIAETAGYGHYFICKRIDFDGNGVPETTTIDSYRAYDRVPVRIPLAAVHAAMAANWDANYDALAFQVG